MKVFRTRRFWRNYKYHTVSSNPRKKNKTSCGLFLNFLYSVKVEQAIEDGCILCENCEISEAYR